MRALVLALVLGSTSIARAESPTLAALAPASDARLSVAIGPAGEVYEPDGKGAWVRRQAGGTAVELVGATTTDDIVIAGARGAPPFKLKDGAWTAIHLVPRARAIVGSGTRALAAVGRRVFALDNGRPAKLANAPAPVVALAASPHAAVIATAKGLHRLEGAAWRLVKKAPKAIRALVSERWALVDNGAFDLKTLKTIAWPAGVRVAEATCVGDTLFAVAQSATKLELLTVSGRTIRREPIPLESQTRVVGIAADRAGRAVVAAADGTLAVRADGAWTTTTVRVELPAARPGPAPATSGAAMRARASTTARASSPRASTASSDSAR